MKYFKKFLTNTYIQCKLNFIICINIITWIFFRKDVVKHLVYDVVFCYINDSEMNWREVNKLYWPQRPDIKLNINVSLLNVVKVDVKELICPSQRFLDHRFKFKGEGKWINGLKKGSHYYERRLLVDIIDSINLTQL